MAVKKYAPLQFAGEKQKENIDVPRGTKTETLYNYIPDPELVKAVNLALILEMPLLVMGEPGCGKSLLAKAIAYDLYEENMYDYYREWHIKSNSKAQEGLYEFDYVRRLRDATVTTKDPKDAININNVDRYINLGAMGEAFQISRTNEGRAILLIDEIDKADIDFPNDLLNELDRMEFEIKEKRIEQQEKEEKPAEEPKEAGLPVNVKAAFRPIVVITSNSEKDLPDAFLRRCIFHYIEPLSDKKLKEIVIGRFYENKEATDPLIDKSIKLFVKLREAIKNELLSVGKNVSTSEFLNWFQALKHYDRIVSNKDEAEKPPLKDLIDDLAKLDPEKLQIPFKNILLKNINSVIRFNEKEVRV